MIEFKLSILLPHARFNCLIDKEAIVAKSHFSKLAVSSVASLAYKFASCLNFSLSSHFVGFHFRNMELIRIMSMMMVLFVSPIHCSGCSSVSSILFVWAISMLYLFILGLVFLFNLVNWEILVRLLTLWVSFNRGWILLGKAVSVLAFVESLIYVERRGGGKCDIAPHRGNRRLMPCCSEPLELMKVMFFIFPPRGWRRRTRWIHFYIFFYTRGLCTSYNFLDRCSIVSCIESLLNCPLFPKRHFELLLIPNESSSHGTFLFLLLLLAFSLRFFVVVEVNLVLHDCLCVGNI